jgi:hypothetical protein
MSGNPADDVAVLRNAINQLGEALQQTRAQVLRQNETIATLSAGNVAESPREVAKVGKVPKPDRYSGTTNVRNWTYQMEVYLTASRANLESQDVVFTAAAYLTGSALSWWRYVQNQATLHLGTPPSNWHEFSAAIQAQFQPVDPEQVARDRLDVVKQARSVKDYIASFTNLLIEIPGMTEAAKVHRFVKGLRTDLRVQVAVQRPTTLMDAMKIATAADNAVYLSRGPSTRQVDSRPSNGPVPMDTGAAMTDRRSGPRRRLGPRAGVTMQSPDACFNCGQDGHQARDCPDKKKNASRGSSKRDGRRSTN